MRKIIQSVSKEKSFSLAKTMTSLLWVMLSSLYLRNGIWVGVDNFHEIVRRRRIWLLDLPKRRLTLFS